jgi:uncharacterized protein
MKKQILFIQGAGQGAYEEDEKLVASLRNEMATEYKVQYPRMSNDDSSGYEAWKTQVSKELSAMKGEVILVGHSFGASLLLKYLAGEKIEQPIAGVFLIATPYWGAEDWQNEYALEENFAVRLPKELPIVFYHSRDDDTVPFAHLALYKEKLPRASFHELDGRGHQFNNDLSEVARDIKNP